MSMSPQTLQLAEIARDLDMVVFRLERPAAEDRETLEAERARVRRDLEDLRDQLNDVVRVLSM